MLKRELRVNFRSFVTWTTILMILFLAVFLIYPSIITSDSMNSLNEMIKVFPEDLLRAFNMDISSIDSAFGWIKTEGFVFVLLITGIYGGILGSSILLKEENDKTIEYLNSLPVKRTQVVMNKAAVGILYILLMIIVLGIFNYIGLALSGDCLLYTSIRPETILISVMFANNEIGTVEPIKEIGAIAKEHGILFHTDAVQAFGQLPINVDECNIDMLSASGHKLNGPKGIGFLYIRKGVKIRSFVHGGAQERKRRAGTENVPGIIGIGAAVKRAVNTMEERTAKEVELRDYMIARIEKEIPYAKLNGHRTNRLPNNVNFSFRFIEGESLLIMLDMKGICASSGSACTSGSLDPSHVLLAIGLPHEIAHGSLRMTLSEETTKEDIDYVVDVLKEIVDKLRSMSPLYEDFVKKQNKK